MSSDRPNNSRKKRKGSENENIHTPRKLTRYSLRNPNVNSTSSSSPSTDSLYKCSCIQEFDHFCQHILSATDFPVSINPDRLLMFLRYEDEFLRVRPSTFKSSIFDVLVEISHTLAEEYLQNRTRSKKSTISEFPIDDKVLSLLHSKLISRSSLSVERLQKLTSFTLDQYVYSSLNWKPPKPDISTIALVLLSTVSMTSEKTLLRFNLSDLHYYEIQDIIPNTSPSYCFNTFPDTEPAKTQFLYINSKIIKTKDEFITFYSGSLRNKHVFTCPHLWLAIYLVYRFDILKELPLINDSVLDPQYDLGKTKIFGLRDDPKSIEESTHSKLIEQISKIIKSFISRPKFSDYFSESYARILFKDSNIPERVIDEFKSLHFRRSQETVDIKKTFGSPNISVALKLLASNLNEHPAPFADYTMLRGFVTPDDNLKSKVFPFIDKILSKPPPKSETSEKVLETFKVAKTLDYLREIFIQDYKWLQEEHTTDIPMGQIFAHPVFESKEYHTFRRKQQKYYILYNSENEEKGEETATSKEDSNLTQENNNLIQEETESSQPASLTSSNEQNGATINPRTTNGNNETHDICASNENQIPDNINSINGTQAEDITEISVNNNNNINQNHKAQLNEPVEQSSNAFTFDTNDQEHINRNNIFQKHYSTVNNGNPDNQENNIQSNEVLKLISIGNDENQELIVLKSESLEQTSIGFNDSNDIQAQNSHNNEPSPQLYTANDGHQDNQEHNAQINEFVDQASNEQELTNQNNETSEPLFVESNESNNIQTQSPHNNELLDQPSISNNENSYIQESIAQDTEILEQPSTTIDTQVVDDQEHLNHNEEPLESQPITQSENNNNIQQHNSQNNESVDQPFTAIDQNSTNDPLIDASSNSNLPVTTETNQPQISTPEEPENPQVKALRDLLKPLTEKIADTMQVFQTVASAVTETVIQNTLEIDKLKKTIADLQSQINDNKTCISQQNQQIINSNSLVPANKPDTSRPSSGSSLSSKLTSLSPSPSPQLSSLPTSPSFSVHSTDNLNSSPSSDEEMSDSPPVRGSRRSSNLQKLKLSKAQTSTADGFRAQLKKNDPVMSKRVNNKSLAKNKERNISAQPADIFQKTRNLTKRLSQELLHNDSDFDGDNDSDGDSDSDSDSIVLSEIDIDLNVQSDIEYTSDFDNEQADTEDNIKEVAEELEKDNNNNSSSVNSDSSAVINRSRRNSGAVPKKIPLSPSPVSNEPTEAPRSPIYIDSGSDGSISDSEFYDARGASDEDGDMIILAKTTSASSPSKTVEKKVVNNNNNSSQSLKKIKVKFNNKAETIADIWDEYISTDFGMSIRQLEKRLGPKWREKQYNSLFLKRRWLYDLFETAVSKGDTPKEFLNIIETHRLETQKCNVYSYIRRKVTPREYRQK